MNNDNDLNIRLTANGDSVGAKNTDRLSNAASDNDLDKITLSGLSKTNAYVPEEIPVEEAAPEEEDIEETVEKVVPEEEDVEEAAEEAVPEEEVIEEAAEEAAPEEENVEEAAEEAVPEEEDVEEVLPEEENVEEAPAEMMTSDGEIIPPDGSAVIPEETDDPADEVFKEIADDTVRAHYTFIELAALMITFFAIALTLLLIRQTERYGEDNIQFSFESFFNGSYTQAISNRYINQMRLDDTIAKAARFTGHIYGIGNDDILLPEIADPFSPDDQPGAGGSFDRHTGSYTSAPVVSVESTDSVSVNASATGVPVTLGPPPVSVENNFTGKVSQYTSLTSSFTTTGNYVPSATRPPETPPSESSSDSSDVSTDPSVSDSETQPSDNPPVTDPSSEPTSPEDTPPPETPSETPAETTVPPAPSPQAQAQ